MACCKIGCKNIEHIDEFQEKELAFINSIGQIVKIKIQYCKDHSPENILDDFEATDIMRHFGY